MKYERMIRKADFRDEIMVWCPLRAEYGEKIIETSSLRVWIEWPPFDAHVCEFEVEQWLNACYIDLLLIVYFFS